MYASVPTRFRGRRRVLSGLGDAQADYGQCLAAQSRYRAELAIWNKDKTAYDAAVKVRSATMAGQASGYASASAIYAANHAKWVALKKAHDAWAGQMAGKSAGYAMAVAALLKKYPNVKLAAGAPPCVSPTVHADFDHRCYLLQNPIKGLGAYSWDPYNACFVAAYPVCTPNPAEPPRPGPEPQPPTPPTAPAALDPLRAPPTAPAACVAPPVVTAIPGVPTQPTPAPGAPEPAAPVPADTTDTTEAALLPESRASGGLLLAGLLALVVGGGIYLVARRRRAA